MEWRDGPPEISEKPRIKLGGLIVAGPLLIVSGLYLQGRLAELQETGRNSSKSFGTLDRLLLGAGSKTLLVVWCVLGAIYLFGCYWFFKVSRDNKVRIAAAEDRLAAVYELVDETIPRAPTPPVERPLPPAPRIGDDPFRDPPGPKPLIVKKAELASAPTPRTSTPELTNPEDRPKFLK